MTRPERVPDSARTSSTVSPSVTGPSRAGHGDRLRSSLGDSLELLTQVLIYPWRRQVAQPEYAPLVRDSAD